MGWICIKCGFSTVAREVMLQAAVRGPHLGLCVVTVGLGRKTFVPNG